MEASVIFQIVPRAPGGRDGVGDYARTLAVCLQRINGSKTTFLSATSSASGKTKEGFDIQSLHAPISDEQWGKHPKMRIVLHYVNYGYHRRGIPFWLPKKLRRLQQTCGSRLVTVFHELYASGSWRQSAFWLRPMQKRITAAIARLSDVSVVSSEVFGAQLQRLGVECPIIVKPVFSNFGEPVLFPDQIGGRDPHRWVICGGTELIERSVRSLLRRQHLVEKASAPRELFVIGGGDSGVIRKALDDSRGIVTHYLPNVKVAIASGILASCSFGWIDYFEHMNVPTGAILKSTAFAAYCAHGVIPVFPRAGSSISLHHDALPGPFFVTETGSHLPMESERPNNAWAIYFWYGRNAASVQLAQSIAQALER